MPTPLYDTDVQKIVDRTPKTAMLDTDVFVVADEDGTLAPITKPNAKETLGIDNAEDRLDTLEGADTVDGSVLKDIKDNAQDATYDNTDSGLTAETLKTAVDELADEKEDASNKKTTLTDNSDTYYPSQKAVKTAVDGLAGVGRTTETVKGNADAIGDMKGTGWTDENLVDHETRLSGLDTLEYEGTTYRVSMSIVNGHIVEHYEEVV